MNSTEDKAIGRLRASKMESTNELFASGKDAGTEYVLESAEFLELERLQRWRRRVGFDFSSAVSQLSFRDVAKVMADQTGIEDEILEPIEESYGDDINNSAWLEGFVVGALEAFERLQHKL